MKTWEADWADLYSENMKLRQYENKVNTGKKRIAKMTNMNNAPAVNRDEPPAVRPTTMTTMMLTKEMKYIWATSMRRWAPQ